MKKIKKIPYVNEIYTMYIKMRSYLKQRKYSRYSYEQMEKKLSADYHKYHGKVLDWNNLKTYTEKMQWAKLYDTNPLKTKLSDKFRVREYISCKIGDEYLIPLIGVWENFDEIDFDKLPNCFVLKTNHGTRTNLIVEDKSKLNIKKAKKKFNFWMKNNYAYDFGFELHYKDIKPLIIAEKFIQDH